MIMILYLRFVKLLAGLVLNIFLALLPMILKLMNKQQVNFAYAWSGVCICAAH